MSEPNGPRSLILSAAEGSWIIGSALGMLAIPSVCIGYLSRDLFIGLGTNLWGAIQYLKKLCEKEQARI